MGGELASGLEWAALFPVDEVIFAGQRVLGTPDLTGGWVVM
jgi:hypothetical protein